MYNKIFSHLNLRIKKRCETSKSNTSWNSRCRKSKLTICCKLPPAPFLYYNFYCFMGGLKTKTFFYIWAETLLSASYFHNFISENKWSNRKKLWASSLLQALNRNSNFRPLKCTFHCIDWTLELKRRAVFAQVFRKCTLNTRLRRCRGISTRALFPWLLFVPKKKSQVLSLYN